MSNMYKKLIKQQNTIKALVRENMELQEKYQELETKHQLMQTANNNSYAIAQDMILQMKKIKEKYESCISLAKESKIKYDNLSKELYCEQKENRKRFAELIKDLRG